MRSMIETIEIAILGTLIAVTLSVPVGLFSARNIAPNFFIFLICRVITVFFRAIPEFIMAMVLVIAIGFGAMPGVLALGFHTMGFLAKFYAEDIEHVNSGPIEALNSIGATRAQCISFAVIPQIMPSFIGNNLYILDRNIRMATMLGIVGAGGIGYELQSAFRMFNYPRVSAIVIIIFITIFFIDLLSSAIRKEFNEPIQKGTTTDSFANQLTRGQTFSTPFKYSTIGFSCSKLISGTFCNWILLHLLTNPRLPFRVYVIRR